MDAPLNPTARKGQDHGGNTRQPRPPSGIETPTSRKGQDPFKTPTASGIAGIAGITVLS